MGMLLVGGAQVRHIVALAAGRDRRRRRWSSTPGCSRSTSSDRLTVVPRDAGPGVRRARRRVQPRAGQDRHRRGRPHRQGLFKGTQTRLGIVPEQHTDFIFTAVGEELGFVGAGTAARAVRRSSPGGSGAPPSWPATCSARSSASACCRCSCSRSSRTSGMTMGIMPITGIPLPVHVLRRLQHPRRLRRASAWCSTSTCAASADVAADRRLGQARSIGRARRGRSGSPVAWPAT